MTTGRINQVCTTVKEKRWGETPKRVHTHQPRHRTTKVRFQRHSIEHTQQQSLQRHALHTPVHEPLHNCWAQARWHWTARSLRRRPTVETAPWAPKPPDNARRGMLCRSEFHEWNSSSRNTHLAETLSVCALKHRPASSTTTNGNHDTQVPVAAGHDELWTEHRPAAFLKRPEGQPSWWEPGRPSRSQARKPGRHFRHPDLQDPPPYKGLGVPPSAPRPRARAKGSTFAPGAVAA